MSTPRKPSSFWVVVPALATVWAVSCSMPVFKEIDEGKTIPFDPNRPTFVAATTAAPYAGGDQIVKDAQATYRTGLDLHRKLIMRSCSGTNGVCHNQKEYPDMHTAAAFTGIIGAPCNVQPGTYTSVYDRCERSGDRFRFDDRDFDGIEIGHVYYVLGDRGEQTPNAQDTPGLHIRLHDPVPLDNDDIYSTGLFVRTFKDANGSIVELPYANYTARWWILGDGRDLFAEVDENDVDEVATLIKAGIIQGDQNRNNIYGARAGTLVTLLNPAKPEESYLVARLRSRMLTDYVPGTRMPLANQPPSNPDMVALMCFIEQLNPTATQFNLESEIDYNACSYSADAGSLNIVGGGVDWNTGIRAMLQAYCSGCHGGTNPTLGLDMNDPNLYARLLQPSAQKPSFNLIQPGRPEASYLWLKVSGDGSVIGKRMPLDPGGVPAPLPDDVLNDLQTWIIAGAPP